jgi:hypothetical protein
VLGLKELAPGKQLTIHVCAALGGRVAECGWGSNVGLCGKCGCVGVGGQGVEGR